MTKQLFIGIDGGATKCVFRVEDARGALLAESLSGPANIRISVPDAWASIQQAKRQAEQMLGFSLKESDCHVGMGLAGCEIETARQAFLATPHSFRSLIISSDAHTACLGAHAGEDGAIIVIGTGVVGFAMEGGKTRKVSGWGFPHDDLGGGAFLGLRAIAHTLQVLDGRATASLLSQAVRAHFHGDHEGLVAWANTANSTAFATIAPLVLACNDSKDAIAINLLKKAASEIDRVIHALSVGALPLALIGSIAPHLEPYLAPSLRTKLSQPKASPEAGAIMLARQSQRMKDVI